MQVQASISNELPVSFALACILSSGLLAVIFGQIVMYSLRLKTPTEFRLHSFLLLLLTFCSSGVLLGVVVYKMYNTYPDTL